MNIQNSSLPVLLYLTIFCGLLRLFAPTLRAWWKIYTMLCYCVFSFQHCVRRLKSAMVGICTPRKSSNTTKQGFSPRELVAKYLQAHQRLSSWYLKWGTGFQAVRSLLSFKCYVSVNSASLKGSLTVWDHPWGSYLKHHFFCAEKLKWWRKNHLVGWFWTQ